MFITLSRSKKVFTNEQVVASGLEFRSSVVRIIKYNYCRKMTIEGLCTEKCMNCQAHILNALTKIDPTGCKKVDAVFIWRLRNEASQAAEAVTSNKKVGVRRDSLGEPSKQDAWSKLMDECVAV